MTKLSEIITPQRIACNLQLGSKKRVLECIGDMIASSDSGLLPTEIFDSLIARERLGSTGIGHGVAIPHGRLENIDVATCAFVSLEEGIDFDAVDRQPVNLVLALVVPVESTEEHLQLLAQLAEMFSDEDLRQHLRDAKSSEEIYDLLIHWQPPRLRRTAAT